MAEFRERPYSQFNFIVSWDGLDGNSVNAGFQEVSGLGMEINMAEYRAGNYKDNAPMKITGTYKVTDVTLKRGVIGALDLYQWLDEVRNGSQDARCTITIELQNEDHSATAITWKLMEARPTKYTGPSLNGKGNELAVDEVAFAAERIEMA